MSEVIQMHSELAARAARLRRMRSEGEAWPLLAYEEILTIADRWDVVGRGSGCKSMNAWLHNVFGDGWKLGRFRHVRDVVGYLGEDVRRTWLWPAAQWAYNHLTDTNFKALVLREYPRWVAKHGGNPLSVHQVRSRVKALRAEFEARAAG